MDGIDELLKDFLVESYENLDRLDQDFLALETDPTAQDKLGSIFRTIHTIKGTCGCLGLSKLEAVAHTGENLLSRLRDGQLVMDTSITTALLKLADAVREMLASIESTHKEGNKDYSDICRELILLNERPCIQKSEVSTAAQVHTAPVSAEVADPFPVVQALHDEAKPAITPSADGIPEVGSESLLSAPTSGLEKEKHIESLAGNAIRVDVGLLDKLMNLVGELVLARNQVLQFTASEKDSSFQGTTQRLNLITSELQESVMKTRMQPIDSLWSKFPRIVRDVSMSCGKKIRIEMEGRNTELDKTILEAIKDPLTHILRNSIDHGVETPEVRKARGKPEEGVLHMRAFHEGGRVNIEIRDDGAGIDAERVKRKALSKGLISADQAARMTERDAIDLIFLPGFSTAERVTNVSGRGVGMDVVKTNVEKIGGTVDVQSRLGEGTTLRIKIPLTLAIIPALVVTSGGERFAIPQVSLLELVRIEGSESKIEMIHGTPVYRLRGKLLPLIYLNRVLKLNSKSSAAQDAVESANIVVLRGGERQFGLVVDQINDTEEIVVKPLGKQLKGVNVFAGATIMGDGRVALILDVMGLAQKANVVSQSSDETSHDASSKSALDSADRQMMLLCSLPGGRRVVIPLSIVARLEEFPGTRLEHAGGLSVVQYRDQIMPLVDVGDALSGRSSRARLRKPSIELDDTRMIQVVVYAHEGRNIGLRVEQVLDIVEERVQLQTTGERAGVLGTTIIKDKVTELLDVRTIVQNAAVLSVAA